MLVDAHRTGARGIGRAWEPSTGWERLAAKFDPPLIRFDRNTDNAAARKDPDWPKDRHGYPRSWAIRITDAGRSYVEEHAETYAALYPAVATAATALAAPPWPEEIDDHVLQLGQTATELARYLAQIRALIRTDIRTQAGFGTAEPASPEQAELVALTAARLDFLTEQEARLATAARAALGRYLAVAIAVAHAAVDGTDPHTALEVTPLEVGGAGVVREASKVVTGLGAIDAELALLHGKATGRQRGRLARSHFDSEFDEFGPHARHADAYADRLARLVADGALVTTLARSRSAAEKAL